MKTFVLFLAALPLLPVEASEVTTAADWDAAHAGLSPVARVVALLKDIRVDLETEADADDDTRQKQSCWCTRTAKEKEAAIEAAADKIAELDATIEDGTTEGNSLSGEIEDETNAVQVNEQALENGTRIRETEAARVLADERQMVQDIAVLKNAIVVLSKHHDAKAKGFLQGSSAAAASLRTVLQDISARFEIMDARIGLPHPHASAGAGHAALLDAAKTGLQATLSRLLGRSRNLLPVNIAARTLQDLAEEASTPARPTFLQSTRSSPSPGAPGAAAEDAVNPFEATPYAAKSTEIWGILNQMLESFESDLNVMQEEELNATANYKGVAKGLGETVRVGKARLNTVQGEQSVLANALVRATDDRDELVAQKEADEKYLEGLPASCDRFTTEWEARVMTRQDEVRAVDQALQILMLDTNRDHLANSVSFLELHASAPAARARSAVAAAKRRRAEAAKALRRVAQQPELDLGDLVGNWEQARARKFRAAPVRHRDQLATLAVSVRDGEFDAVKAAIDTMMGQLRTDQQEEVTTKDGCVENLHQNELSIYEADGTRNDTAVGVLFLAAKIDELQKEIDADQAIIDKMNKAKQDATDLRDNEGRAASRTETDQAETQRIIAEVRESLRVYYGTDEAPAPDTDTGANVDPDAGAQSEAPASLNNYKDHSGASVVLELLEVIFHDSARLVTETKDADSQAHASDVAFQQQCDDEISAKESSISTKTAEKADAEGEKISAEEELGIHEGDLAAVQAVGAETHEECNWLLKHFTSRQAARFDEIEGLQSAKAILSGSRET